jgi:glycerol-1-phosphatase
VILAQAFSRFVLDLDGVVWSGDEPIPGAPETVRSLRDAGKRIAFVTNNSSQLPETYAKKLASMGAGGDSSEIVTSADATARLLAEQVPGLRGRTAFVIGGPGLFEKMREVGLYLLDVDEGAEASLIVVGIDTSLTYEKLRAATLAIRAGATFVASNDDPTYPTPDGQVPGAGAIVAAIRTATGVDPLVAGKPQPQIMELARDRVGGAPALVIGDRVTTDILAARAIGWPAALVLTGATGIADLAAAPAWPDYILRRLPDLLQDIPHPRLRQAAGPDLPAIATLLHDAGLPARGARERAGRTIVADADRSGLLGTSSWEPLDNERALIRSVAISTRARSRGVGTTLVAATLRQAIHAGSREVWCVTTDAEEFFTRCGFVRADREALPEAVAEHAQVRRECPETAAVMRLRLPAVTPPSPPLDGPEGPAEGGKRTGAPSRR